MTLDEFRRDWQNFRIVLPDGSYRDLTDMFAICLGPSQGGLMFDSGGEQDGTMAILRTNANREVFRREYVKQEDIPAGLWKRIGSMADKNINELINAIGPEPKVMIIDAKNDLMYIPLAKMPSIWRLFGRLWPK